MEVARAPVVTPASWPEPASRMQSNMQSNSVSPPTSGRSIPSLSELMHRASVSPSLGVGASRPGEKSYSEPSTPALFNSPSNKSDQARFTRIPLSQLMASASEPSKPADTHHPAQLSPSTSTASVPNVPPSQPSVRIPPPAQNAGAYPMTRQDSSQLTAPTFHSPVLDSFVQVPFNSSSIPKTMSLGSDSHINGSVQRTSQQTGPSAPRSSSGSYSSLARSPRPHPLPIRESLEQRSVSLGSVPSHSHYSTEGVSVLAPGSDQTYSASPTELQRDITEAGSSAGQTAMHATSNDIEEEIRRLSELVTQTSPQALHAVLRKYWRPFIFQQATDDHTSFILRAGLQNASPKVMERVVRDKSFPSQNIIPFLPKKQSVIDMCLASATAQMIQDNVPATVLDDVFFTRITVMPSRRLATMLAEAGRLGFTLDDLVDEEDDTVVPAPPKLPVRHSANTQASIPSIMNPHTTQGPSHAQEPPAQYQQYNIPAYPSEHPPRSEYAASAPGSGQSASGSLCCGSCKQKLPSLSGYNYHISKNVCEKGIPYDAKWSCHNCLKYFTTKQGQTYHQMKRVCYGIDIEPSTASSEEPVSVVQHPQPVPSQPPAVAASFPPQPVSSTYPSRIEVQRYHPSLEPEIPSRQVNIQPVSQSRKSPASTPPPASNRLYPSELPPEQLNELNAEIDAIQRQYERAVANIPATLTPQEREQKLTSLKNSYNTRKSVARKKHGVSLRKRVEPTYRVTPPPKNELVQSFRALPPLTSAPPKPASYTTPTAAQTTGFNAINSSSGSVSRSSIPEIRPPNWEIEMNHLGQRLNQSIKRTMDSSPDSPPPPATVQRTAAVTRPSMVMAAGGVHNPVSRSMDSAPNREVSRLIDLTADSSSNEAEKSNDKDKESSSDDDDEDIPAIPRRRMSDNSAQRSQPMMVDSLPKRHDSYPSTFVRASSVDNQVSPRRREKGKEYAVRGGRRSSYADRASRRPSSSGSAV